MIVFSKEIQKDGFVFKSSVPSKLNVQLAQGASLEVYLVGNGFDDLEWVASLSEGEFLSLDTGGRNVWATGQNCQLDCWVAC